MPRRDGSSRAGETTVAQGGGGLRSPEAHPLDTTGAVPRLDMDGRDGDRVGGLAAIDELRAFLASEDPPARGRGGGAGGGAGSAAVAGVIAGSRSRPDGDRPVPLDRQVRSMAGEAPIGRLRRAPLAYKRPPGSQVAADPFIPLMLSDFHDLRRLGLFGDDGRNPPPSWWAR